MSDLTATNCGCSNNNSRGLFGNNSWIWILLLLSACGNDDDGCSGGSGRSGFGLFNNDGNSCCNTLIWLLILSSCCGNW